MDFSICLPDASVLRLDNVSTDEKTIVFEVASQQPMAICPLCRNISRKVHSHYQRTLADLPLSGMAVRLLCRVRKFFCLNEECRRRIFVERLTAVAAVSSRQTIRLNKIM